MSSDCPEAPLYGPVAHLRTFVLPAGTTLVRFHGSAHPANSFNPNIGKKPAVPKDGAGFNPFPDENDVNVPTVYAGDNFSAAALESVFHDVPHTPSPRFLQKHLDSWQYTRLEARRDLVLFELTNPHLRQLDVPGRSVSLLEAELIHSEPTQYPNTRTWARYLFHMLPTLQGLAWRPRLGGQGTAYVFFGGRSTSADLHILSAAEPINSGPGLLKITAAAKAADIQFVTSS